MKRIVMPLCLCVFASLTLAGAVDAPASSAPDLAVVGWTLDDLAHGNGDGGLHPGETATLRVWLTNRGSEGAFDVQGTLGLEGGSQDAEVTIKHATWADLPAASWLIAGASFEVRAGATRPCASDLRCAVSFSSWGLDRTTLRLTPQGKKASGTKARGHRK